MLGALERVYKRVAELVFVPAVVFAGLFAYARDWENVSVSAGIAAAAFTYWMAMYTRADITR